MERQVNFDPTKVSSTIIEGLANIQDKEEVSQLFGSRLWEINVQQGLPWFDLLSVIDVAEEDGYINPDSVSIGYRNAAFGIAD